MERLLREFGIDKLSMYKQILYHGNKICLQLLETESKPFDNVVEEIIATKKRLLSPEFIISDLPKMDTIPFRKDSFVYFLYDNDELVYIGKTGNLSARVGTHVLDRTKAFNAVGCIPVNKSIISITEEVNIYKYTPIYNSQVWSELEFFRNVLKMCVFE